MQGLVDGDGMCVDGLHVSMVHLPLRALATFVPTYPSTRTCCCARLQELPPPTGCLHEEMVVLNEVVIDRGTNAWLTNLQVYVDQNLVTVVQVGVVAAC